MNALFMSGIALDWITENIYWTDFSLNQVWMARSDGRYQRIIARNLAGPHGIVVDQTRKWVLSRLLSTGN